MLLEDRCTETQADEFIKKMEESVRKYKELLDLGLASYIRASFLTNWSKGDWSEGLKEFEDDLQKQRNWLDDFAKQHN